MAAGKYTVPVQAVILAIKLFGMNQCFYLLQVVPVINGYPVVGCSTRRKRIMIRTTVFFGIHNNLRFHSAAVKKISRFFYLFRTYIAPAVLQTGCWFVIAYDGAIT
jgi:hypothetical protein